MGMQSRMSQGIYPNKKYPVLMLAAKRFPKIPLNVRVPESYVSTSDNVTRRFPQSQRSGPQMNKYLMKKLLAAVQ